MTRVLAVREFLNLNNPRPVGNMEFMEFWKACSEPEKMAFALSAAEQLGTRLIEAAAA